MSLMGLVSFSCHFLLTGCFLRGTYFPGWRSRFFKKHKLYHLQRPTKPKQYTKLTFIFSRTAYSYYYYVYNAQQRPNPVPIPSKSASQYYVR